MTIRQIIPEVILASQSISRKLLLEKLQIKFETFNSNIDESQLANEQPLDLVKRLSKSKANYAVDQLKLKLKKDLLVIGSDQIAVCNNKKYGKPGNFDKAYQQLQYFNDQTIEFITGLSIIDYQISSDKIINNIYTYETSKIKIKKLSDKQIINYLKKDKPYNCAASIKIEGLGISLVEEIITKDHNAIIGLPLIKLIEILNNIKLDILSI